MDNIIEYLAGFSLFVPVATYNIFGLSTVLFVFHCSNLNEKESPEKILPSTWVILFTAWPLCITYTVYHLVRMDSRNNI